MSDEQDENVLTTTWEQLQQIHWLAGFARLRKVLYAGTVPGHVKARRRRRNKAARLARRVNR